MTDWKVIFFFIPASAIHCLSEWCVIERASPLSAYPLPHSLHSSNASWLMESVAALRAGNTFGYIETISNDANSTRKECYINHLRLI